MAAGPSLAPRCPAKAVSRGRMVAMHLLAAAPGALAATAVRAVHLLSVVPVAVAFSVTVAMVAVPMVALAAPHSRISQVAFLAVGSVVVVVEPKTLLLGALEVAADTAAAAAGVVFSTLVIPAAAAVPSTPGSTRSWSPISGPAMGKSRSSNWYPSRHQSHCSAPVSLLVSRCGGDAGRRSDRPVIGGAKLRRQPANYLVVGSSALAKREVEWLLGDERRKPEGADRGGNEGMRDRADMDADPPAHDRWPGNFSICSLQNEYWLPIGRNHNK